MSGIAIRLYSDSHLSRKIFSGDFEVQETKFVTSLLTEQDIFVDVGANVGLYTLLATQRVKKKGRIFSFEPCKKTFTRLLENVHLNNLTNVYCFHMALSDKTGKSKLNTSLSGSDAMNSFTEVNLGSSTQTEIVETTTLDVFVTENDLEGKISLIKIDVEGWESHVLDGGMNTLMKANAPSILIEFNENTSIAAGTSCLHLAEVLQKLGYILYRFNGIAGLEPMARHESNTKSYNVVAIKNKKHMQRLGLG